MHSYCIMGPTCVGKTQLALDLCVSGQYEIISVDSALIYRDMDIGTAKPTDSELAIAPHHLINILDPSETYCAAQFCKDASALIQAIHARGKTPLLVGGTMLYFYALQYGLAELPDANASFREALDVRAKEVGWEILHEELATLDSVSAKKIKPQDSQRISRALEVYHLTGEPLSELLKQTQASTQSFINIPVLPQSRQWLHENIAKRFHTMLKAGFLDEVKALYERGCLHPDLPAMRAVGYRQAWAYFDGDIDYDTMVEKAIIATRQLAKRQITWVRKFVAKA